jgi:HSP20 family protein
MRWENMKKRKKDDDWRKEFDRFFDMNEMDHEFESMRRYMDKILESMMHGEIDTKRINPFVYGFSMRVGPDGQPHIQRFGNTTLDKPVVDSESVETDEGRETIGDREPLTDVIESENSISITVEIPGVEKNDVNLEVVNDILVINVDTPNRRYFKEVELPTAVDPSSAKATYNNGVLDITLVKTAKDRKGTKIVVE